MKCPIILFAKSKSYSSNNNFAISFKKKILKVFQYMKWIEHIRTSCLLRTDASFNIVSRYTLTRTALDIVLQVLLFGMLDRRNVSGISLS